ncbi:Multi antimicrobial extrusion protein (Na(+)/drug antiporter), MATE family of MDR efflux pump [Lachnospiraceae bacterium TWA4]|nr:Multi antimicrobial extrusion protein (Na(+)/drug antiporter), MATE family of MDR efflux pump [Lachnospiraceae bacterium TWA4]
MTISLSDHFGYKKLIQFTLPTIAMMIFTSIYGIVDGLFISNIVGSEAFAAVNLILPVIMVLGSFGFMIGTGGSALVSKTLGENHKKRANEYFSMLIYLMILSGILFAIIGILFLRPIAGILGATEGMLETCIIYGAILMVGLPSFMLQNSFQSFLVVAEKPRMGLVISIISGITNMVFDFLLVYVFQFGVAGAGVATLLSQIVGAIIPMIYFIRENDSPLKLVKTSFDFKAILKASMNGASEMVTNISVSLVSMLYNWQLLRLSGERWSCCLRNYYVCRFYLFGNLYGVFCWNRTYYWIPLWCK